MNATQDAATPINMHDAVAPVPWRGHPRLARAARIAPLLALAASLAALPTAAADPLLAEVDPDSADVGRFVDDRIPQGQVPCDGGFETSGPAREDPACPTGDPPRPPGGVLDPQAPPPKAPSPTSPPSGPQGLRPGDDPGEVPSLPSPGEDPVQVLHPELPALGEDGEVPPPTTTVQPRHPGEPEPPELGAPQDAFEHQADPTAPGEKLRPPRPDDASGSRDAEPAPIEAAAVGKPGSPGLPWPTMPEGTAVALAAAGVSAAAGLVLLLGVLQRQRRVAPERVLESGQRRRILQIVQHRPGCTAADVAHATRLHYHTVQHHLRVLTECNETERLRLHGRIHWFPNHGQYGARVKRAAVALSVPSQKRMLEELGREPGLSAGTLATRANVAPATGSHHLKRLVALGLAERRRDGARVRFFLAQGVAEAVRALPTRPPAPAKVGKVPGREPSPPMPVARPAAPLAPARGAAEAGY